MTQNPSSTAEQTIDSRDPQAAERPLCVGLDGALVSTDTLHEAARLLVRRRPWLLLMLPLWLLGGRKVLRRSVAGKATVDPRELPYRRELLGMLRSAHEAGRRVVLVAAGDRDLAQAVADHLGGFSDVVAGDGDTELDAQSRLARLRETLGDAAFDYIGTGRADEPLCRAAAHSYLVGIAGAAARERASELKAEILSGRRAVSLALLKALRPHQWAKNALVFLPVLLLPGLPEVGLLATAALATAAFSLVASAGYVFNDLVDLEADRVHLTKYTRPFASGDLPVAFGPPLFVALIAVAGAMTLLLPPTFVPMLIIYFVATLSYSFYLKSKLVVDVLVLAGLYTHRIFAGGIAASIPISAWLLAFSMFFFLSLALAKRYVELLATGEPAGKLKSRGYRGGDLEMVASMGTASGYIAVLVFSFYVDSDAVRLAYRHPAVLWFICPVLLYWISRIWFLAHRGEMQDDPVKFALRDRLSLACGATIALIAGLARFAPAWLVFG